MRTIDSAALRGMWLAVLWLAALAAGCATVGSATPEQIVQQRAQARWAALIAGDWDKAYGYMAPSYRTLVERKRFANQFGGGAAWQGVEVVSVTCKDERCTALVKLLFRPVIGPRTAEPMSTHFEETWVREDGQWWMFQKL